MNAQILPLTHPVPNPRLCFFFFIPEMPGFGGIEFVNLDFSLDGTETALAWESGDGSSSSTTQ